MPNKQELMRLNQWLNEQDAIDPEHDISVAEVAKYLGRGVEDTRLVLAGAAREWRRCKETFSVAVWVLFLDFWKPLVEKERLQGALV